MLDRALVMLDTRGNNQSDEFVALLAREGNLIQKAKENIKETIRMIEIL